MAVLLPGSISSGTPNYYKVFARSGWEIPQGNPPKVHIDILRGRGQELIKFIRPKRAELRSVDPFPYNCVGLVFASRRAWIEADYIHKILLEDGYRSIKKSAVREGDVVVYRNSEGELTHVALVLVIDIIGTTPNIKVMSKWGLDPEFVHFIDHVPDYFGNAEEFWTDRRD